MFGMALLQVLSDTHFKKMSPQWTPVYDTIGTPTTKYHINRKIADSLLFFSSISAIIIIIVDKRRKVPILVILERLLVISAILYALRTITFSLTSYPPPNPYCILKTADTTKDLFELAIQQLAGTMTCTDLLFSGHALTIILSALFIDFYSSYRHIVLLYYIIAVVGSFFIIAAKMHYSSDVFLAWVVAMLVFTWYHMMITLEPPTTQDRKPPKVMWKTIQYIFRKIDE